MFFRGIPPGCVSIQMIQDEGYVFFSISLSLSKPDAKAAAIAISVVGKGCFILVFCV